MTREEQAQMLSEIFDRLRTTETNNALLGQKMDALSETFKDHDNREMRKFDTILKEIQGFKRLINMAAGGLIVVSVLWKLLV